MRGLINEQYGGEKASIGSPVQMSRLEILKQNKKGLEDQLNITNKAIEALEKNPEILRVIDLLNRVL